MNKVVRTLIIIPALLAWAGQLLASPVAYAFRVTDNSGNLVAGATVAVGSTTLTSNTTSTLTATSLPTTAGEKVLSTNAAPAAAASVTLIDYGTGDYALVYDPATQGELYIPLTVSKSGSAITGSAATIALTTPQDSSVVLSANTQATAAATQATGANSGTATNGANISALSNKIGSPSGASIDADILSRSTYSGGPVASVTGSVGSVTGSVGSVTTPVILAASQAFSNSTASSVQPTWYTAPPSLPGDFLSSGEQAALTTAAANTPAATVAALLAGSLITIPGTGTTTGTSEVLTYKQEQALVASISAGAASNTAPTASGSATVTYYLLGQPKVTANIVAVSTPTYDANKVISGRTILIQQPFPAVQ